MLRSMIKGLEKSKFIQQRGFSNANNTTVLLRSTKHWKQAAPARASSARLCAKTALSNKGSGLLGRMAFMHSRRQSNLPTGGRSASLGATQNLGMVGIGASALGIGALYTYGMTAASTSNTYADYVRERVSATYTYVAGGLGLTAVFGALGWNSPLLPRMMASPIMFAIGSFVGVLACTIGIRSLPTEAKFAKNAAFLGLTAFMGLSLCPMGVMGGPILLKAAAATAAVVGSLTLVAGAAPSESFLSLSGPLAIGLGIILAASVGSMFFPASPMLQNVVLYGGLGVFGGFTLYDTQRLVTRATHAPNWDPINESISLYLNFINIFVRIAQIMFMNQQRRR